jgi:hypothetical protein
MPNEKVRHWLVAQSHTLMEEEGFLEDMDKLELAAQSTDPDHVRTFNQPTDTEKARAKAAYDTIQEKISKRDLQSDGFIEDFLSEKSFKVERFADPDASTMLSLQDDLLEFVNEVNPEDEVEDIQIKREIQELMEDYAKPAAQGQVAYSEFESQGKDEELKEPDYYVT